MEEYIVSSNESPLKKIKIETAVTQEVNDAFMSPLFNSPNIRTPHDSHTLNEFQGIFASSAKHTSLKLHTDYQRSSIQRLPTHPVHHQSSPVLTYQSSPVWNYLSSPVDRVVNPLPANFRRPSHLTFSPQAAGNYMHMDNAYGQ